MHTREEHLYVEGATDEDLVVGQTLRSEVVEYIKRKLGVCFSIWYKA